MAGPSLGAGRITLGWSAPCPASGTVTVVTLGDQRYTKGQLVGDKSRMGTWRGRMCLENGNVKPFRAVWCGVLLPTLQVRKLRPRGVRWPAVPAGLGQGLSCVTWLWGFSFASAGGTTSLPSSSCFSRSSSTDSSSGAFGLGDSPAHRYPLPLPLWFSRCSL